MSLVPKDPSEGSNQYILPDLALQDHDSMVEVMMLQGCRRPIEQGQSGTGPGGITSQWFSHS